MDIIKRHKGLAIVGTLSLILLVIIFIIVKGLFFNENKSTYGDRLNGIVKIDSKIKDKIKDDFKEIKEVEEVSTRTQGKIIYTTIKFKEGTKLAQAKEIANKILTYYDEDVMMYYDFGFFLVENKKVESDEDKKGFVVAGNKHPDNKSISWTE